MRNFKSTTGPFRKRPFYEQEEIERICSDELRAVSLLPAQPEPIRVDRYIEKKWGITHQYEQLPDGILGFSRFGENGVEAIVVSRTLEEESTTGSERRIRTTLAHEVGHVLLQGHLLVSGKKPPSLFDDGLAEPKILCRGGGDGAAGSEYDGKWWEFQANRAIGALLMPRNLVEKAIDHFLVARGTFGAKILETGQRAAAVQVLAATFNVNPAAAKTRIDLIHPLSASNQLTL